MTTSKLEVGTFTANPVGARHPPKDHSLPRSRFLKAFNLGFVSISLCVPSEVGIPAKAGDQPPHSDNRLFSPDKPEEDLDE